MPSLKAKRAEAEVLEAICRCIASIGIEKTSLSAIAREAGVSRSLVAHYLPPKDEMFTKVIAYIAERGVSEIEDLDDSASGDEKFLQMMRNNLNFFIRNDHYLKCFLLFFYLASISPDYRALNSRFIARFVERSQRFLKDSPRFRKSTAAEIHAFAESTHWQLIGAIQKYFVIEQTQPPERYIQSVVKNFRLQLAMGVETQTRR